MNRRGFLAGLAAIGAVFKFGKPKPETYVFRPQYFRIERGEWLYEEDVDGNITGRYRAFGDLTEFEPVLPANPSFVPAKTVRLGFPDVAWRMPNKGMS